jgi:hypothetical protein
MKCFVVGGEKYEIIIYKVCLCYFIVINIMFGIVLNYEICCRIYDNFNHCGLELEHTLLYFINFAGHFSGHLDVKRRK